MTAASAKKALSIPLRFGDAEQIKALRFLTELDRLKQCLRSAHARVCPGCEGNGALLDCSGMTDLHDSDCDGECGLMRCHVCEGGGVIDADMEPIGELEDFAIAAGTSDLYHEVIRWMRLRAAAQEKAAS